MSFRDSNSNSFYSGSEEYIPRDEIVRETFTKLTIDNRVYNRLVGSLDHFVSTASHIRAKINKTYVTQGTQTRDDDIGINDTNRLLETIQEESDDVKDIKQMKVVIDNLKVNSDKEIKERNALIVRYQKEISTLKDSIKELKEDIIELKNYRNINELQKLQLNNQRNINEIVFHTPKAIQTIASYLSNNEILPLAQVNKTVFNCLFYKSKDQLLMNKLKQREVIINSVISPDTAITYDLTEETIEELIQKYIINAYIPGTSLRNRIIHSLMFIEKNIRNPLREIYNEQENSNNSKGRKQFFKSAFSSIASMIQGGDDDFQLEDDSNDIKEAYLTIPNNSLSNTPNSKFKQHDRDLIKLCERDENLNVLFEFASAEQIKELIEYFFNAKLNKAAYAKFLSAIVEQYSKLLYACYSSIKEIKELEIVNHAINSRFRRYKFLCQEMQVELNDLSKFAKSSKEIKDILLRQKNSVEIKYNDSRLEITHLLVEKGRCEKKINQLTEEMSKSKIITEAFKDKLVKEYKIIQADYNNTKKEREMLRKIIIDFKNYFLNYVSTEGEII